jgi:hypothetical protein
VEPHARATATVILALRVESESLVPLAKVRARAAIEAMLAREHGMKRLADWETEISFDYDTETVRGRTYELTVGYDAWKPEGEIEALRRLVTRISTIAERCGAFAEADVRERTPVSSG